MWFLKFSLLAADMAARETFSLGEPDAWSGYRDELRSGRITWFVRTGAFVVFAINTAFVVLDYFAYPEQFGSFLWARGALNGALLAIYFRFSRTSPERSEVALCLSTGAMLLIVIYGSGAPTSEY